MVAFLEVSRNTKHFHSGAKQEVFKDAISALKCIRQRNEEEACEDLFLVNNLFLIFTCKLGSI